MKTAEEWLQSEWRASRPMAEMVPDNWHRWFIKTIVAIQADALETAAQVCDQRSLGGAETMESDAESRACATTIRELILELIPTAPSTHQPGEPSKSPGHRTSGT